MRGPREAGLVCYARIHRRRLCKQEAREFSRRLHGPIKPCQAAMQGASSYFQR